MKTYDRGKEEINYINFCKDYEHKLKYSEDVLSQEKENLINLQNEMNVVQSDRIKLHEQLIQNSFLVDQKVTIFKILESRNRRSFKSPQSTSAERNEKHGCYSKIGN